MQFHSRWACEDRPARIVVSDCALGVEAPGFSRPMMDMVLPQRLVSGLSGNAKYKSIWVPGANTLAKSKEAGKTPITFTGLSLMVSGRPIIDGSDANRRSHKLWLINTAPGPCHLAPYPLKSLPNCGFSPSRASKVW